MPIFSIGFVVSDSPGTSVSGLCATAIVEWPVRAIWKVGGFMNCGCDDIGCIQPGYICAPSGDDLRVVVSVYDQDGDEYDLSGATEIVFAVYDQKGGQFRFAKRLSDGEVVLAGTMFQAVIYLTDDDTILPVRVKNYYEVRVTNSAGEHKTVSAGLYRAERTMNKDLV